MSSSRAHTEGRTGPGVAARDVSVAYGRGGKARMGLGGFTAEFHPGITGLIGPNGAGKTTFLRAAAGLLTPTWGSLEINGKSPAAYVAARGVGFLPEHPALPGYLTVQEFLQGLRGPRPGAEPDPDALLRELLRRRLDSLSTGQRKRAALTAALVGSPGVLLLDEPTNGLDPMAARDLREILERERERGATLIVSSHHLDELQRTADALVFVKDGRAAGAWSRGEALDAFGSLESLFHHVLREG